MSNGICKSLAAAGAVWVTGTSIAQESSKAGQPAAAAPVSRVDALPPWAADAIWYQVFVPRFANGDPANDLPGTMPWKLDWLNHPADDLPVRTDLFGRRYGGDLAGLQAKLPYLRDLGVNTLYLNPIFAAESQHKYDTIDLRHVDDSFGVAGALDQLGPESTDPAMGQWSASDRVFLDFLERAHGMGFRVVLDGVFNHVGRQFWAFQDVLANGRNSAYADWFDVTDFGPPLQWNAWDGPNGHLVRFARDSAALPPAVEQHIFDVTRRWMDPDGDGDPSDGIDGWRLDAPQDLPHEFWRRWHKVVKSINPQAIILGEIWTDPSAWMGDQFDSVTNYRMADAIIEWLRPADEPPPTTAFAKRIDRLVQQYSPEQTLALVNLLGSHDTDRAVSMLANPGRLYDRDNLPGAGDPPYNNGRPTDEAYSRFKLAATLQYTLPGAPMLYYGDEAGMYGGEDPYSRGPMWWQDAEGIGQVGFRPDVFQHIQMLIKLRNENPVLRRGAFHVVLAEDRRRLLAYERVDSQYRFLVFVNGGPEAVSIRVTFASPSDSAMITVLPTGGSDSGSTGTPLATTFGAAGIVCSPLESVLLTKRGEDGKIEILQSSSNRSAP